MIWQCPTFWLASDQAFVLSKSRATWWWMRKIETVSDNAMSSAGPGKTELTTSRNDRSAIMTRSRTKHSRSPFKADVGFRMLTNSSLQIPTATKRFHSTSELSSTCWLNCRILRSRTPRMRLPPIRVMILHKMMVMRNGKRKTI